MPAAQVPCKAVVWHIPRAAQPTSHKHGVDKNKGATFTETKVDLSKAGVILLLRAQLLFICFCWAFPTAALQGNCIVLGAEDLAGLYKGSFLNTLSKLRVTAFQEVSVSWTVKK